MKYIYIAVLLALLLSLGCTPESDGRDFTWTFVKSPLSGRCYEMVSRMLRTDQGVMSISEIPCKEMEGR